MEQRYDAAIVGAGPEGLVAAQRLASAGLRIVVLEKAESAGGRAVTREIHPGFRAAPFCDTLAPIPNRLFWDLNLAGRGVFLKEAAASMLVSDEGVSFSEDAPRAPSALARARIASHVSAARAAVEARASIKPERKRLFSKQHSAPWAAEDWTLAGLDDVLTGYSPLQRLHAAADALAGRAASPYLPGSALHLLAAPSVSVRGGLGTLTHALEASAREAGADIRFGQDVHDIKLKASRFGGPSVHRLGLASGEEIQTKAILSTLDLKRTFLGLIAWADLSPALLKRIGQFRTAGQSARVLFALDAPPEFLSGFSASRGPVHVVPSMGALAGAHESWRAGAFAEHLPVTLRVPSLVDAGMAPPGKAVMSATISSVPSRLFDGPWTPEKRGLLAAAAIAAAERAAPGVGAKVLAHQVIAAPDIEALLGLTEGDLDGGELSPDQMFGFRPLPEWQDGRTGVKGLYLAGPSSAESVFFTGLSGARAASALLSDLKK